MGYIENLRAQAEQAAKAKAFDDQQIAAREQGLADMAYNQGRSEEENKWVTALNNYRGSTAQPQAVSTGPMDYPTDNPDQMGTQRSPTAEVTQADVDAVKAAGLPLTMESVAAIRAQGAEQGSVGLSGMKGY